MRKAKTIHTAMLNNKETLRQFLSFFDYEDEYEVVDLDGDVRKVKTYVRDYDHIDAIVKYKNEFGENCEVDIDVVLILDDAMILVYGGRTFADTERLSKLLVTMMTAVDFEDVGDFFAPISEYYGTIYIEKRG